MKFAVSERVEMDEITSSVSDQDTEILTVPFTWLIVQGSNRQTFER